MRQDDQQQAVRQQRQGHNSGPSSAVSIASKSLWFRQGKRLIRLEQLVLQRLPSPLEQHCKVAALENGCLLLTTDSPAWASRLRFVAPGIIRQLASEHKVPATSSQVRIQIPEQRKWRPSRRRVQLSLESARLISQLADSIEDDKLSKALQRLASHAANKR